MRKVISPYLIIGLFFISTNICFGQTGNKGILWQKCLGGSGSDSAKDILMNPDGSIVVVGSTTSNDGNVSGNHGSSDAWIVKLDASGNVVWQKCMGGSGADAFNTVIRTNDNAYLCVGYTNSADGDIIYNNGSTDCFVVKIDQDGNIIWSKTYGGLFADYALDAVATTDTGYAILAGSYSFDGDVNSGRYGRKDLDTWVIKLNSGGKILWEHCFDAVQDSTSDYDYNILQTSDNVLTVYFRWRPTEVYEMYEPNYYYAFVDNPVAAYPLSNSNGALGSYSFYQIAASPVAPPAYDGDGNAIYVYLTANPPPYKYYSYDPFTICKTAITAPYYVATLAAGNAASGHIRYPNDPPFCTGYYSYAGNYSYNETDCEESGDYYHNPVYFANRHGLAAINDGTMVAVGDTTTYGSPFIGVNGGMVQYGGSGITAFTSVKISPNGQQFVAAGYTNANDGDISGNHGGSDCWIVKVAYQNKIVGNVFIDTNGNGIQDAGEPAFNEGKIFNSAIGASSYAIPCNGHFENTAAIGTYTDSIAFNKPYYNTPKTKYTFQFTSLGNADTADFPITPIKGIRDYAVDLITTGTRLPNLFGHDILHYSNVGTDTLIHKTVYYIKDSVMEFSQYYYDGYPDVTISGDTLSFLVDTLFPGRSGDFDVYFSGPYLPLGSVITSIAYIDSTGDKEPADNVSTLSELVRGSYDPNDKVESHGGKITPYEVMSRQYLTYTIDFQNVGNGPATSVYIKDTLDAGVDPSTIEMISSSHAYTFNLSNNIITWTFNNIVLADCASNDSLSKGFITYRIKPYPNFIAGNSINNSASVYFDYNLPVMTPQAVTIFIIDSAMWTGGISSAWENPRNWGNDKVPDPGSDVFINPGMPHYPEISSKASCRSIHIYKPGSLKVNTGYSLSVSGIKFPVSP